MVLCLTVFLLGFGIANVAGACSSDAKLRYNEKKGNIELDIQDFCSRCTSDINSTASKDSSSSDKDVTYELSVSFKVENGVLSMEASDAMLLCILHNKSKHKENLVEDTKPRKSIRSTIKSVNRTTVYDTNQSTLEDFINKSEPTNKVNDHYTAQRSDDGNITEIISHVSNNTVSETYESHKSRQEPHVGVAELQMGKNVRSNIKNVASTTIESTAELELNEKTSASPYIDTTPTAENALKSETEKNETSILYESDENYMSTTPNTRKNIDPSYTTFIDDPIKIQVLHKLISNYTIENDVLTTSYDIYHDRLSTHVASTEIKANKKEIQVGTTEINDIKTEIQVNSTEKNDISTETQIVNNKTNDISTVIQVDSTEKNDISTESQIGNTETENFSTETLAGSNETKDISTQTLIGSLEEVYSSTENSTQEEQNMRKNFRNALGLIAVINIMLVAVLLLFLLSVAINRIRKSGMSFRLLPVRKHYALLPLQDRCAMDQGLYTMDHEA